MTKKNNNDDGTDVERVLDALSSAKEWYNQNSDLFAGIGEAADTMSMETPEPLTEAHINEDVVRIVAEVRDSDVTQMGVGFEEGTMVCEVSDRTFEVEVPDDIDESSIEATMSNGVLEATIQRTEQEDSTVDVIREEETGKTMNELFDETDEEGGDKDGSDE